MNGNKTEEKAAIKTLSRIPVTGARILWQLFYGRSEPFSLISV